MGINFNLLHITNLMFYRKPFKIILKFGFKLHLTSINLMKLEVLSVFLNKYLMIKV